MKPAISYYGGKQRLATKIVELLPPHTVYVEPFCGGAAVMFHKGLPRITNTDHYREAINDLNKDLINVYRVLQDRSLGEDLVHRLNLTPYAREEYARAGDILRSPDEPDPIARAWAYMVNVSMSFGGIEHGGWVTSAFSQNQAATWARSRDLSRMLNRLRDVHVECENALDVIRRWDSPQTCFYIDPPYPGADQHYRVQFSQVEFDELISLLGSIDGSFLLSCYENAAVPSDWERFEFSAFCSASGKGMVGPGRDKTKGFV